MIKKCMECRTMVICINCDYVFHTEDAKSRSNKQASSVYVTTYFIGHQHCCLLQSPKVFLWLEKIMLNLL